MQKTIHKMYNQVQHYGWGSHDALTTLYGIADSQQRPMAELWMGAHPKSSSQIENDQGQQVSLREMIATAPVTWLGETVAQRFGELPFLFKVLCAEQPLSIQVHPSKSAAVTGFAKENQAGIPLDAPDRNYKDENHKPELVFALTPFQALNGFRELGDIANLLQPLSAAHPAIAAFLQCPDTEHLANLFAQLLGMEPQQKTAALSALKEQLSQQQGGVWETIRHIARFYPDDSGLFSPLLFNVVTLLPGEAMFLYAKTPHAYLHGVALEVMANSDNVLRAGLTPKYIDLPELLANLDFKPQSAETLLTQPRVLGDELIFPVPVDDFAFSIHQLSSQFQPLSQTLFQSQQPQQPQQQKSAAIVFCIEGYAQLESASQSVTLQPGESCFIRADDLRVQIKGRGKIARVYNELNEKRISNI